MGQSRNCSSGRRRLNPLGSHCHGLVQLRLSAVSDWMKGKRPGQSARRRLYPTLSLSPRWQARGDKLTAS